MKIKIEATPGVQPGADRNITITMKARTAWRVWAALAAADQTWKIEDRIKADQDRREFAEILHAKLKGYVD